MALKHFRFPKVFFRQTKKAYISFVTSEKLSIISNFVFPIFQLTQYNQACSQEKRGINMDICEILPQDFCFTPKTVRN
jgi:hypothetical protein